MAANQVLSQAEIDALLGGRPGDMELKPEPPPEPDPTEESPVNVVTAKNNLPDYAPEDVKSAAPPPDRDALGGLEAIPNPQEMAAQTPVQNPAAAQEPEPVAEQPVAPLPPVAPQPAPVAEVPQPEAAPAVTQAAPAPVPIAGAPVPQVAVGSAPLESAIDRIRSLEQGITDMKTTMETMQQGYQAIVQHLNSMNTYIQNIRDEAEATPGHGLRKTFVCEQCAAKGSVAAKIQCTSCGDESWWGWWTEA